MAATYNAALAGLNVNLSAVGAAMVATRRGVAAEEDAMNAARAFLGKPAAPTPLALPPPQPAPPPPQAAPLPPLAAPPLPAYPTASAYSPARAGGTFAGDAGHVPFAQTPTQTPAASARQFPWLAARAPPPVQHPWLARLQPQVRAPAPEPAPTPAPAPTPESMMASMMQGAMAGFMQSFQQGMH